MAYVLRRELPPLLMEFHVLAQPDSPALAIGSHLPPLSQFRNVRSRIAINANEVFQGWTLIEHAAATLQPRIVGVPPQGRHSNDQPLQLPLGWRLCPGNVHD